ncbi:MAG: hypothetical protein J6K53_02570 [Roseburia sp.]|nr:hypothetical protein [Roseburia sp.]
MGIEIYPQTLKSCLSTVNLELQQILEATTLYKNSIEAFIGEENLTSIAYGSEKDYMRWGHLPAIQAQVSAIRAYADANQKHIFLIDAYLSGEYYLNEDILQEQLLRVQQMLQWALLLQAQGVYEILDRLRLELQRKLDNLYEFAYASAGIYTAMRTNLDLMVSLSAVVTNTVYKSDTNTYLRPTSSGKEKKNTPATMTKQEFSNIMTEQFGFDKRTGEIMYDVYMAIQKEYEDKTQQERDWYFARALSQLGDYNSKKANIGPVKIETNAWRKGAGWVYKYDEEESYFCNTLGLSENDYTYLRYMLRLQHFITSKPEDYSYGALLYLWAYDPSDFASWKKNMETATGTELSDIAYVKKYKLLYDQLKDNGDCSHMFYTISANLIDNGHKVDNSWKNIGAPDLSWSNADVRKDITGWLGDAVYLGDENQTSFGTDDYIADLDADNLAHRCLTDNDLLSSMQDYYTNISNGNADEVRTREFLKNNSFEDVEKTIFDIISCNDANKDGFVNTIDLKENSVYSDTYDFLMKLKKYQDNK